MKKKNELVYEPVDYSNHAALHEVFEECMIKYADLNAICDKYNDIHLTYNELRLEIENFACGLQQLGVKKGDFVCLITENQGRWFMCQQAIMKCGAIATLRGSNAPIDELNYIMDHSEAKGVILRDTKTFNNLKEYFKNKKLDFIIITYPKGDLDREGIETPIYTHDEIIEKGKCATYTPVEVKRNDPCCMLYTSGTTGFPKGALISHDNLIFQIEACHIGLSSNPGEKTLQVLPVWHAYEQIGQIYYFSRGCHVHFTNLVNIKNDLAEYKIDSMMSVPRIWEAFRIGIYSKLKQKSPLMYKIFDFAIKNSIAYKTHKMYGERRITNKLTYNTLSTIRHKIIRSFMKPMHVLFSKTIYKKLRDAAGLNFRASISGGGAISMQDELFYDALGVNLRVGYGLTETSPVLTLRNVWDKNYLGAAGSPVKDTEIKIVDPKTKEELPRFVQGLVMVRGRQIMLGYYKDEAATKAVISEDGWFNTGDLGWLTFDNNLVLVGRLKETIVLSSGENVEPVPIEEACLMSPYIDQMVLVGQDKSGIGALIVPSKEALEKCGIDMKGLKSYKDDEIEDPALFDLIKKDLNKYIENKPNLKVFEKIKSFAIIKEGFNAENGLLSSTAKVKRNKVFERFSETIKKMYK